VYERQRVGWWTRQWRDWWVDVRGTTVLVAWPAAATKEERQNGAARRGKKQRVVPNPKTLARIRPK